MHLKKNLPNCFTTLFSHPCIIKKMFATRQHFDSIGKMDSMDEILTHCCPPEQHRSPYKHPTGKFPKATKDLLSFYGHTYRIPYRPMRSQSQSSLRSEIRDSLRHDPASYSSSVLPKTNNHRIPPGGYNTLVLG